MRVAATVARRSLIRWGRLERATSNRNSTAVATLFTFCPPGPDALTNRSSISFSLSRISPVTRIIEEFGPLAGSPNLFRLLRLLFFLLHRLALGHRPLLFERRYCRTSRGRRDEGARTSTCSKAVARRSRGVNT